MELDKIDRHILNQLQQDNRISNANLAALVGLSPPACLKRVQRLRKKKLIVSDVSILDPKLVGRQVTIIVEIEMERDRPDLYQRFAKAVNLSPEVSQCYQVTGEVDMVLIVNVADMEVFQSFVERVIHADPNVRKFRTLIAMKRKKFTTAVHL
jgi:Lrp/AsnC family transcriptional regulator, leucine-responsive regulatory protein